MVPYPGGWVWMWSRMDCLTALMVYMPRPRCEPSHFGRPRCELWVGLAVGILVRGISRGSGSRLVWCVLGVYEHESILTMPVVTYRFQIFYTVIFTIFYGCWTVFNGVGPWITLTVPFGVRSRRLIRFWTARYLGVRSLSESLHSARCATQCMLCRPCKIVYEIILNCLGVGKRYSFFKILSISAL